MKSRWLIFEILIYLCAFTATLIGFFVIHKPTLWILLAERFFLTMFYTLSSLIFLYFGVKLLVSGIFFIKIKWAGSQWPIHLIIVTIFLMIIIINMFPIVFWIKLTQRPILVPIYLILSNMLLYYFCLHTYREIQDESKKLYIASARFKHANAFDYLKEKRQWVMLNNIRPMFYHLFSFTLFTDTLALADYPTYQGIVGYIFVELKESKSTFSLELLLALIITGLLIYPIKRMLEWPEHQFAMRHNI